MNDNIIEEVKRKIKKVQNIKVDISDLSLMFTPATEGKEYENSLEGELLQELDETKDIYKRADLQEKIKQVREQKKEEATKNAISDIEKIKENIQVKVKEQENKITSLEAEIESFRTQKEAYFAEMRQNRDIMKLKQGNPSSAVYKAAKEESLQLLKNGREEIKKIKQNREKIAEAELEIENLNETHEQVNNMLLNMDVAIDLQEQQEDEMWNEYRKEQKEKQEEEAARREQEIDEAYEEKQREEWKEKLRDFEDKKKEIDNFFNEEALKENDVQDDKKWDVKEVICHIEDGELVYSVILENENETKELSYDIEDEITKSKKEKQDRANSYDVSVKDIDTKMDTTLLGVLNSIILEDPVSEKAYTNYTETFKENSENIDIEDMQKKLGFKITYDLRNLNDSNLLSSEKRQLKRLAKNAKKMGIGNYIKKPNFLEKLFKLDLLDKPKEAGTHNRENTMKSDYYDLSQEDGFSMETFKEQYGLTDKQAEELEQTAKERKLEEKRKKLNINLPETVHDNVIQIQTQKFTEKDISSERDEEQQDR